MFSSHRSLKSAMVSLTSAAMATFNMALPASAQAPMAGISPLMPLPTVRPQFKGEGSGNLEAVTKSGQHVKCPLKHTSVSAHVSGHVTRVTVKQLFSNPAKDKIEAIYTFPLSDSGAVDDMLMKVGERTIHGTIKKKEEARKIYEQAKNNGQVAALLDQERPNIFMQSVANIEPQKDVEVTISYVDLLPYEAGTYTFAFPTVVGPRFNPPSNAGHAPHQAPVAQQGERAGHDISIDVAIDSTVPVLDIKSDLHEVKTTHKGDRHVDISLVNKNTIPNKDFVLNWTVASDQVRSGYLTHGKDGQGFFNLSIMPPKRPRADQIQPKEMVFLIDCSGSQDGPPLQKCKEVMHYSLNHMNDNDTFQVIAFSSTTRLLFGHPEKATGPMRAKAHKYIDSLTADGGTWMGPAVEKACSIPADENRLRIVSFMTDGYVGNDFEIVGLVKKLRGKSRWFPFGTGNSVNRFLIDNIAKAGGGEADYVLLNTSAEKVGKKFYDKIASPVLTDIKVDFNGLETKEVFPKDPADVWAEKPVYITGRYTKAGHGNVTISGFSGGKPYNQTLSVDFPENNPANSEIASVWARAKVDRLMDEDWFGAQSGSVNKELREEIVRTAIDHHIMTQYTSFVAVDKTTKVKDGKLIRVEVPIEVPDGVNREMALGDDGDMANKAAGSHGYYSGALMSRRAGFVASPAPVAASKVVWGSGGGGGRAVSYNSPGASAPVHGKLLAGKPQAAFYKAAPSIEIVDESPIVTDKRAQNKKDDGKAEEKAEKQQVSKASKEVERWIYSKSSGTLKVKLTFANAAAAKDALKNAGVTLIKQADGKAEVIIALVTKQALQKLLKLDSLRSVATT